MTQALRYDITDDDVLVEAIAAILRTASSGMGRECSCYLATVSAAYMANRLAASGFLILRESTALRLDV